MVKRPDPRLSHQSLQVLRVFFEQPKESFAGADILKIHLNLIHTDSRSQIVWQVPVAFGGQALLQTSTDLVNWVSVTNVVNHGGAVDWDFLYPQQSQRFFRAVPQPN